MKKVENSTKKSQTSGRTAETLQGDIGGLLEEARKQMGEAAAAFVYVHGELVDLGGSEDSDELHENFTHALASVKRALDCIPREVAELVQMLKDDAPGSAPHAAAAEE